MYKERVVKLIKQRRRSKKKTQQGRFTRFVRPGWALPVQVLLYGVLRFSRESGSPQAFNCRESVKKI